MRIDKESYPAKSKYRYLLVYTSVLKPGDRFSDEVSVLGVNLSD